MTIYVKGHLRSGSSVSAYVRKGGADKGSTLNMRNRARALRDRLDVQIRKRPARQDLYFKMSRYQDSLTQKLKGPGGRPKRAFSTGRRSKRWYR